MGSEGGAVEGRETYRFGLSGECAELGRAPAGDGAEGLGTVRELARREAGDLAGGQLYGVRAQHLDVRAGDGHCEGKGRTL